MIYKDLITRLRCHESTLFEHGLDCLPENINQRSLKITLRLLIKDREKLQNSKMCQWRLVEKDWWCTADSGCDFLTQKNWSFSGGLVEQAWQQTRHQAKHSLIKHSFVAALNWCNYEYLGFEFCQQHCWCWNISCAILFSCCKYEVDKTVLLGAYIYIADSCSFQWMGISSTSCHMAKSDVLEKIASKIQNGQLGEIR